MPQIVFRKHSNFTISPPVATATLLHYGMVSQRISASQPQRASAMRWLVLIAASVLFHVAVFTWANGRIGFPSQRQPEPSVITAALLAPPPAKPAPKTTPKPPAKKPAKKPVKPRPKQPTPAPPVEAVATVVDAALAPAPIHSTEPASGQGDNASGAQEDTPALADVMPESGEFDVDYAWAEHHIAPPPSAELRYDVFALRDEQKWYGSGLFRWETDGEGYRLTGEASVTILFKFTILNFSSEGVINDFGVAPLLYTETPWRKAKLNTHFRHAEQQISFSASDARYPYHGGEQDRASIIWQLAGIGRGAPDRFYPGAEIDVMVAGTRDAASWRIQVAQQEEIETDIGKLQTWRLVRQPRPDSGDQRIDIWLAPDQEWYPVKVRYTYDNGDFLDLSVTDLSPITAAGQN